MMDAALCHSTTQPPLLGRVAVVTGAASGIGRATCLALVRAGAAVAAGDRDREGLDAGVTEMASLHRVDNGPGPIGIPVDVRHEHSVALFAETVFERLGGVDVLVCCAGILRPGGSRPRLLMEMTLNEWEAVIETNLRGTFLTNRAFLRSMSRRRFGAHVINVSSTAGRQGRPYDSAYCASKFGVLGMTESLAEEVRRLRIKVTAILPDAVDTPLWGQNGPIPRPPDALKPDRIADLIVYLLSMPEDAILLNPIIRSFTPRRKSGGGTQKSPEETNGNV
jgi:NAD(P)-dependent dehydrogenase (short-subunit alcohol dehydrogenase family)